MIRFRVCRRLLGVLVSCLCLPAGWSIGLGTGVVANDRPPAVPSPIRVSPLDGVEIQPGDQPLMTFEPAETPTAQQNRRREALALFMTGRVLQERGKFDDALAKYLAAIEKDPRAMEAYRSALPILLQNNRIDESKALCLAAARYDATSYELVLAVSAVLVRQNRLPEGISLVQQAIQSPSFRSDPTTLLTLRRNLGLFLRLDNKTAEAAEQYEIVFEAILGGRLDDEAKKKILADAGAMLDEFGEVFLNAEKPELALRAFDEASKYREAKPGLHSYNLAMVFRKTGQPDKALEELQKYFDAQLQNRGRTAYTLLKELLAELKRSDELLPRLEAMFQADSHNDVLRFFLADEYFAADQIDKAASLYVNKQKIVNDPRALVGLLSVHLKKKDFPAMLTVLNDALKTVPRGSDTESLTNLAPEVRELSERFEARLTEIKESDEIYQGLAAEARKLATGDDPKLDFLQAYFLGKLAVESNRTPEAQEFYGLAISMRNDPPPLLFTELTGHLIDSSKYKEAEELLNQAVKHPSTALQRERWRFLFFLSYAQEFQGRTEQAVETVREAQRLQPSISRLYYQEAWIVYHARRWDDALALFEEVMRKFAGDRDLVQDCQFRVSNIYVEKGDSLQGEKVLEDILREDADNTQANNDLGYLWADQGKNLDKARAMIEKALKAEPDNPAYLDSMGWVLFKLGDYEGAVGRLKEATTKKNGEDSTIFDHLGDALEKLGRAEEAQAAWKKALEIEEAKAQHGEKLLKSIRGKIKQD